MIRELEDMLCQEKLREQGMFSLEKVAMVRHYDCVQLPKDRLRQAFLELHDERERRNGYKLQQLKLWLDRRKKLFTIRALEH